MSLRFFLVNDYNTTEVFEITGEEMGQLAQVGAIFMCYKDSIRISNEVPYGVMAFHPSPVVEGEERAAFGIIVASVQEVREENKTTHADEPVISAGGNTLRVPVFAGDLRLN